MPFPFRFQRRDIDDNAAARIGRLAQANRQDIARDTEILDRPSQRKRVRWNDADIGLHIDEAVRVEVLRIDNGRIDVGKDLEFIRTPDIIAITGCAVGNDAPLPRISDLTAFKRLDHAVLLRHAAYPLVRLNAHEILNTRLI